MQSLPNLKLGKVVVGSNIAQNHLPGLKEALYGQYWPNSLAKFTKIEIRSMLEAVRTLFRIIRLAHSKSYMIIICPNLCLAANAVVLVLGV